MFVWLAILLTLVASTCMNLGLVLQKKAVTEPRWRLGRFYHSPLWCTGMTLLVGGYGLFILANSFRAAPISLLQPIFAFGLLVVAVMAVVYLKERFGPLEWLGVALLIGGVVLLGVSAEEGNRQAASIHLSRLLLYLGGLGFLGTLAVLLLRYCRTRVNVEMLYGMLAGMLLGIGYLDTRTLTLAWLESRRGVFLLALALLGVGLLGGLAVLQKGFQHGRALIVTAMNLVINQVVVVAGGVFCLGESFPHERLQFNARLGGLAAVLAGTVILARFSTGPASGRSPVLQTGQPELAPRLTA
jgi:drug/metabolite transporter (DMT)-like permease